MATAINLAHRGSLRIGAAEVRPSTCEILGPEGSEEVEPKVMQVLVALIEAGDRTLTRDDLTALCWDGRIVGNDAMNRVILKIRKLGKGVGGGSFTVRTIPKIGYRLSISEDGDAEAFREPSPPDADQTRWRLPRLVYPAAGALVILLGVAALGLADTPVTSEAPPPAKMLEPVAMDLAMRGAAASFEQTAQQQSQAIRYFRAATARAPQSSALWGSLALNYVLAVPYTSPDRQADLLLRARQAAQRSLRINPGEGHALTAATYLQPTYRNWAAKERLHRLAIERSDKGSPAPIIHYGRFLTSVGRTGDAIQQIEEAMRIHPLVPWLNVSWIELLQVNDRLEEAENAAARAASLWPRNHDLWIARFFLKAFNNDAPGAVAMVDDRGTWPEDVRPGDMALLRRAALAIQSGSAAEADAVLAEYERLAGEGQAYSEQAIRIAARLGRPDAAYRFAEALYAERGAPATSKRFASHDEYGWQGERATAPLFLYPAEALWVDARFMALAERIGLVGYWRSNGAPDVCSAVAETCRRYRLVRAAPTR